MKVDAERLWARVEELGAIGATADGGVSRIGYSAEETAAMERVGRWMTSAGLGVHYDPAGNLIGRRAGQRRKTIVLGSHLDTVPNGGRFDGALGVLAALEAVETLLEAGTSHEHSIEIIAFRDEEGACFGRGLVGSRLASGTFNLAAWSDARSIDGRTIRHVLAAAGLDLERAVSEAPREPSSLAAYLELHIEQGEVLESGGKRLGVVSGIVGITRYQVRFMGRADHAGATPMNLRRDALLCAAGFVQLVGAQARAAGRGLVATVGRLLVDPNIANVIPGRVVASFEVRALESEQIKSVVEAVIVATEELGRKHDIEVVFERTVQTAPLLTTPHVIHALESACTALEVPFQVMPSGGGHDAMLMGTIAPFGMLFVPSRRGISHAPDEYTAPDDCALGAQVLLDTLILLDKGSS